MAGGWDQSRPPAPGTRTSTPSPGPAIPGNPAAAVPSLHGGYAFLVFLFVATLAWRRRGWKRWVPVGLAALYPLAQSFAVVYTGNHYVVDLFIGYVYAAAALAGVWWFWRRRQLPE